MENHLFCQNNYNLPGSSSHAPLSLALTYILLYDNMESPLGSYLNIHSIFIHHAQAKYTAHFHLVNVCIHQIFNIYLPPAFDSHGKSQLKGNFLWKGFLKSIILHYSLSCSTITLYIHIYNIYIYIHIYMYI